MIRLLPLPAWADSFADAIAHHSGDAVVQYKEALGQPLFLSLYFPPDYNTQKRYPLLIWLHGGGFNTQKIFADQTCWAGDQLGFLARRYAQAGYLCACVEYRLMRDEGQRQGYALMDLYTDCMDAACFLLNQAQTYGINENRIAVLGESAGGYLAAAAAAFPWRERRIFRTAVLLNPITDLCDPLWTRHVPKHPAHAQLQGMSEGEKALLLSPVYHICKDVCPTLLVHGAADSVVHPFHALKYHDLLSACGQPVQLDWIEKTDHAFMLAEYMKALGTPLNALSAALPGMDHWLAGWLCD